ncbi:MAG: hypothetical protein JNK30_00175 [Phenylobacterium sp.]|uniref:hypothetical protein n=1 Tax=Phenylobacterium sp. TaxID=1871053 RepID=UPI001A57DF01|nr:hypothetical protein [Phenylobacterium sp.]MBL8769768.1 hypothetical protein [Phenylobacterium sp.]
MSAIRTFLLAAVAAVAISGCDNGPSAVAQKDGDRAAPAGDRRDELASETSARGQGGGDRSGVDRRDDPVKLVDGRPMWSASRRYSAEENARRAFARNGEAFGADSLQAFVEKAHAFVSDPPKGTQTLKRRNGDTLFYDAKSNTFAVASKDGAPRTMFHPDDGPAYWAEQKTREARRSQSARRGREDDDA